MTTKIFRKIESAPRDGSEFIGVNIRRDWIQHNGDWVESGKVISVDTPVTCRFCSKANDFVSSWDSDSVIENVSWESTDFKDVNITHWAPIPIVTSDNFEV